MAETNPFLFGALALDEAFTDREREVAELESTCSTARTSSSSPRGATARPSLVWRVEQELLREVLVAQVDLMTTPTKERLAEKLAKTIHDDIASPSDAGEEAALGAVPRPTDHARA